MTQQQATALENSIIWLMDQYEHAQDNVKENIGCTIARAYDQYHALIRDDSSILTPHYYTITSFMRDYYHDNEKIPPISDEGIPP